ncbi:MAG: lipase family protein [Bacteroidota bacterium]|nr:lipase family protein [Bacteroidota bacterium]
MEILKKSFYILNFFLIALLNFSYSQTKLKPGFDPEEYKLLLEISARQLDTPWTFVRIPFPDKCKMIYRSDSAGLNNRWDFWVRDDSVGIISIRGTIAAANSWSENFFAAMVPASGSIIIDKDFVFIYKLASSGRASVHAGWLTGLAYLSNSIIEKINEMHASGIKNYLIMGHSQGGAIAYLLTSYLHYLDNQRIPDDVKFKTYCSAAPKPGNLFYSYDFDYITRDGRALRVYNSEDWVPQTPVSVQTLKDFSEVNPYADKDSIMLKMSFVDKLVFEYIIHRLKDNLNDARNLLDEYFGKMVYNKSISKFLPEFPEPQYSKDAYYYPCGVPVVLMKQGGYDELIKTETKIPELFENHMIDPYYFLLNKIYFNK